jgi:hypothetical protein
MFGPVATGCCYRLGPSHEFARAFAPRSRPKDGLRGGIRIPDHLIRRQLLVGTSSEVDSCMDDGPVRQRRRRFRGDSGSRPGESLRPIG